MGMTLKSVEYYEKRGRDLEWTIDALSFGQVNLLVGRNSTGKTRCLNILGNLATNLLKAEVIHREANYTLVFDDDGKEFVYAQRVHDGSVVHESVRIDGVSKLNRDTHLLKIWGEEVKGFISFKPDSTEITAAARKDALQHPFLNPLHSWADGLRHYHFGQALGKDSFAMEVQQINIITMVPQLSDRNENAVVGIYKKAKKEFGDAFDQVIIADMASLDYALSGITVSPATDIKFESEMPLPGIPNALSIQESGIAGWIPQHSISHGMFRALSILIQVNYSQMAKRANCILIDDIGEGLDFERSSRLIDILRAKAYASNFQLIMSTNDQFVMNHVPLEEWSLLQRTGSHVRVRNAENSKTEFDNFRFIGLSNFSFFEMDFIDADPVEVLSNEQDGGIR